MTHDANPCGNPTCTAETLSSDQYCSAECREKGMLHIEIARLRAELATVKARRGRCSTHKDTPGPSLWFDCCESERRGEGWRETAAELAAMKAERGRLNSPDSARVVAVGGEMLTGSQIYARCLEEAKLREQLRAELAAMKAERDLAEAIVEQQHAKSRVAPGVCFCIICARRRAALKEPAP